MTPVLTLIAAPGSSCLGDGRVAAVRAALSGAGIETGEPVWLAAREAVDLGLGASDSREAERLARSACERAPIDLAVLPGEGRRKHLLVADMESTIIEQEMLDELADLLHLGPEVAKITARAMRGELDFGQSLEARAALLRNQPASVLERVQDRITLSPGAQTLVRTMRRYGARAALVSGGFGVFAERVADLCGFDAVFANHLNVESGRLLGTVARPILGPLEKRQTLLKLAREAGAGPHDAAAVGDGANDIPLLQAAGLGVAYRAKPAVIEAAPQRLDHADLTGLLYLQGYASDDFVR